MDKQTCMEKIRDGETEAARLLFGQYGEQIYRNALAATKSKEAARTITRETILELIGSLRTEPEKDGWDLWVESVSSRHVELYGLVDRDVEKLGREIFDTPPVPERAFAPEQEPVPEKARPRRRREAVPRPVVTETEPAPLDEDDDADLMPPPRRVSVGSILLTVLLVVGILLLVWVIVGMLMSFHILPTYDLGYAWFNAHLFQLFW